MQHKDTSFRRWSPSAADGGMYDIAEIYHDMNGLSLVLTPDGPNRRARTPHRLHFVWGSVLICRISNET